MQHYRENTTVSADLDIRSILVVHNIRKPSKHVGFLVLEHTGFVVSIAKQNQMLGVWLKPFCGCLDDGVQVSPVVVLRTDVILALS